MRRIQDIGLFLFSVWATLICVQACKRLDGSDGYCISVLECPSALSLFTAKKTVEETIALIRLTCSSDTGTAISVCCDTPAPEATSEQTSDEEVFYLGKECTISGGEMGHCIPFGNCGSLLTNFEETIKDAQKATLVTLVNFTCGEIQSDDPETTSVCCELPTTNGTTTMNETVQMDDTSFGGKACLRTDGTTGQCIPVEDCPAIFNSFQDTVADIFAILSNRTCDEDAETVCCATEGISGTEFDKSHFPDRSECGKEALTDKIYGGTVASLKDFPWMALLQYVPDDSYPEVFRCGGSLINHRYVVTAAHCTREPVVNVRLGEFDIRTDPDCCEEYCADPVVNVGVDKVIVHEEYNRQLHDISLIRLNRDVQYTEYISPICLPWMVDLERSAADTYLTVSGWGQTLNRTISPVKRKVDVPIFHQERCALKFVELKDSQLCAGGEANQDSCQGDSGGPLMSWKAKKVALEGIVSFGRKCGLDGWPTIYTRIESYKTWIRNTIGALEYADFEDDD